MVHSGYLLRRRVVSLSEVSMELWDFNPSTLGGSCLSTTSSLSSVFRFPSLIGESTSWIASNNWYFSSVERHLIDSFSACKSSLSHVCIPVKVLCKGGTFQTNASTGSTHTTVYTLTTTYIPGRTCPHSGRPGSTGEIRRGLPSFVRRGRHEPRSLLVCLQISSMRPRTFTCRSRRTETPILYTL